MLQESINETYWDIRETSCTNSLSICGSQIAVLINAYRIQIIFRIVFPEIFDGIFMEIFFLRIRL